MPVPLPTTSVSHGPRPAPRARSTTTKRTATPSSGLPRHADAAHQRRGAQCRDGEQHEGRGDGRPGRGDAGDEGGGEGGRDDRRHDHEGAVVRLGPGRLVVAPAQVAPVEQPQHDDGQHDRREGRRPEQGHVLVDRQPQRREVMQRKEIGEVGDRQEQRGRVGQPEGRHREGQWRHAHLVGDGDGHRGQQHRRRVEAQQDRARAGEHDDEQPQHHHPPSSDLGGEVRGLVEDAGEVTDLGDDRDGDEEGQHGQDPLRQHREVGHRAAVEASSRIVCRRPARLLLHGEGPRATRPGRSRELDVEALGQALGQGPGAARRLGLDELARDEPSRVLRVVRRARHRDLHPGARRARPWDATSRHTSWIGSRRPARAA